MVSRGKILELLRPDANTGKVHTLLTMEVFGIIRSLMAFRLTGGTKGKWARVHDGTKSVKLSKKWNVPGNKTWLVSVCFHSPLFLFCVLDYIVLGSDSGRIVILEYHPSKNMFEKIHQETFGKSGCRRIVPGQFLAVDPKGRAVMIGMNYNVSAPIQDLLICQLCSFTSVITGLNDNQANLFNVECNNFCELFFFFSR